jgi:hypothetical protein
VRQLSSAWLGPNARGICREHGVENAHRDFTDRILASRSTILPGIARSHRSDAGPQLRMQCAHIPEALLAEKPNVSDFRLAVERWPV